MIRRTPPRSAQDPKLIRSSFSISVWASTQVHTKNERSEVMRKGRRHVESHVEAIPQSSIPYQFRMSISSK